MFSEMLIAFGLAIGVYAIYELICSLFDQEGQ